MVRRGQASAPMALPKQACAHQSSAVQAGVLCSLQAVLGLRTCTRHLPAKHQRAAGRSEPAACTWCQVVGHSPCCQAVPGNRLACSKISSGSSLNQVWCCTADPAAGLLGHFALVRMSPPASSEHSRGGGNPNKRALRLRQAHPLSCCGTLGRHTTGLSCRSSVVVRSKLLTLARTRVGLRNCGHLTLRHDGRA